MDTGASFSLISTTTARRIAIPPQDIRTTGDKALDASDTSMKFLGIVDLSFKIGKAIRQGTFRIWDNTTHEMVLGQDFVQSSCPVTFTTDSLIFHHGTPPRPCKVPMNTDKVNNSVTRIKRTTIVKERSNAMISAVVENDNNSDMILFQPRTNFMLKQQIMCVPMLTECVNGHIEVFVINKTDRPIKLYRRSRIGDISPVSEVTEQNTVTLIQKLASNEDEEDVGQTPLRHHRRIHWTSFWSR